MDLTNKRFVIFGLQGSGKSVLAKAILRANPDHLVYDPMNEYKGYTRWRAEHPNSLLELERVITDIVIPKRVPLFIVDEANRYVPARKSLPLAISELNDKSRHWGISWGMTARRISQFNSDITQLAHYLFIFRLPGRLDKRILNDQIEGLGDTVATLPPHHFAVVENGQGYFVHGPVKEGWM